MLQQAHDLGRLITEKQPEVFPGNHAHLRLLKRYHRCVAGTDLQKTDDIEKVALPQFHGLLLVMCFIIKIYRYTTIENIEHIGFKAVGFIQNLSFFKYSSLHIYHNAAPPYVFLPLYHTCFPSRNRRFADFQRMAMAEIVSTMK